ncbi:MAG TPA: GNAT family N-acetyltransferase [Mycobacteriales bacterium]|jgi:polar amino acid transport system permease protein|nr:GNAT family N-acetyltransferase [Mycobacteriales bacterium]
MVSGLEVRVVRADDPMVAPVLADLNEDYVRRYPRFDVAGEMTRYPDSDFEPPGGTFLVLLDGDEVVAAGAYRHYDADTVELKRVWTSPRRRRLGLGRLVVEVLEQAAREAGRAKVFLTTGPRQPEARALYLALGYTPVGDHDGIVERADGPLPFVKEL